MHTKIEKKTNWTATRATMTVTEALPDRNNDSNGNRAVDTIGTPPISLQNSVEMEAETTATATTESETTTTLGPVPAPVSTTSAPAPAGTKLSDKFVPGDHVYKWCSFIGIPGMYQHHGIVLEVRDSTDEEGDIGSLVVADFSALIRPKSASDLNDDDENDNDAADDGNDANNTPRPRQKTLFLSSRSSSTESSSLGDKHSRGSIRVNREISPKKWYKVEYKANFLKRTVYRSGTCTSSPSDPPGLVLSRVHFLLDHPETLPPYSVTRANCECVAVWCKTGLWGTLQASSFLQTTAAGQVKSATTLAVLASSTTTTVPASGFWGMMGFTTKVSLAAANPMLLPAIVGYGVVTVGGPMWTLMRARQFWNETTKRLHDEFWSAAIERPDVFVECITEWSAIE